jgi:Protein of unknown function (DUF3800)
MSAVESGLRAFGGGPLLGASAVRFIHLDEAGTSSREPYVVVAGIVSHADNQWRALNRYLLDMANALIPEDLREGLIFHAKDLWHGSRKFNRQQWPRPKRLEIMEQIAIIPEKFAIPVVIGIVEKEKYSWGETKGQTDIDAWNYALAFGLAAGCAEYFMRKFAEEEVATIILEDVPHMRAHARRGYNILQNADNAWAKGAMKSVTPLTRIVEHPMFAAKDQSSILQIADLLAFVMCRRANGKTDVAPLVERFASQIVMLPEWLSLSAGETDKLGPLHRIPPD